MEVYLINIEIPINIFNLQYIYFIDNSEKYVYKNNIMYGLYAWSTDKTMVDEFMNTRSESVFKVRSKKVDKKGLKELKKKYKTHQLDLFMYKIKHKGELKDMGIISIENEFNVCNSAEDFILTHFSDDDTNCYQYLNSKYQSAVYDVLEIVKEPDTRVTKSTVTILFYLFRFMFIGA